MNNNDIYRHSDRHEKTTYSAEKIANILDNYFSYDSVIDVGCGVGTFLTIFEKRGVKDIVGIDSSKYVDLDLLEINREKFIDSDLEDPPVMNRKFDLALSLEVAEHLQPEYAEEFVRYLTNLSNIVCFSAAVPGQGGIEHINEQWQDYWVNLFKQHGYCAVDCIRSEIWSDEKVLDWYAQNTILYVKEDILKNNSELLSFHVNNAQNKIRIVHPTRFTKKINEIENLRNQIRKLKAPSFKKSLKYLVKSLFVKNDR